VKFFFDNNLAAKIAHGLNEMVAPDHQVIHLRDKFAPNSEDVEWMGTLAKEADWIIITADVRIRRNLHEVKAWKEAGHTIFFLKPGWTDLKFWDQVNKFTKCFPQIIENAARAERGSAFFISVNGKIESLD
jgi:PIN like domain